MFTKISSTIISQSCLIFETRLSSRRTSSFWHETRGLARESRLLSLSLSVNRHSWKKFATKTISRHKSMKVMALHAQTRKKGARFLFWFISRSIFPFKDWTRLRQDDKLQKCYSRSRCDKISDNFTFLNGRKIVAALSGIAWDLFSTYFHYISAERLFSCTFIIIRKYRKLSYNESASYLFIRFGRKQKITRDLMYYNNAFN